MLFQVLAQAFGLLLAPLRTRCIAMRVGQPDEAAERVMQEEAKPHAFTALLVADAVHAVVPIPAAHQWQAALAEQAATALERKHAVRIQRAALRRRRGHVVIPFLFGCHRAPLDVADHFVQHAGVAGNLQVAACALRQPEVIVRTAGAHAATLRRVPPVHHIAFGELVCSA
ncbi:hypothetical protein D3C71_1150050 [compost metagenome]